MTVNHQNPTVFTKGYALCSPEGKLQSKTFRDTRSDAIAARYRVKRTRDQAWAKAQAKGWTAPMVYVRIFVPVFYTTASAAELEQDDDEI